MAEKKYLTKGGDIDGDYRDIKENGQQKDYIVLCPEERGKGYIRPLRFSYVHNKCGTVTTMGSSIAETYARNPYFYSSTFCVECGDHFPLKQFLWEGTNDIVGS